MLFYKIDTLSSETDVLENFVKVLSFSSVHLQLY